QDQFLIDALARLVGSFIGRHRAHEQIQQLAQIPMDNPSTILKLDDEAQVTYMNPAAVKTMTELKDSPDKISHFLPADIQQLVDSCISSERAVSDLQVTVNGLTWLWSLQPVRGRRFVHAWATDITRRVQREAELKRLTAAVNQSASLIVITATDGTIEYTNSQFCRFLGYSAAEVVGQRTSILKSGRHGPAFYREMWQTIALGKPWTGTLQNKKKDGTLYWERKIITPIFGDGGEIRSFLSVGEDITTERRLQQRAVEQEKLSAVGMLAAGVAHEFKNYLAGIIGNASLALEDLGNDDAIEIARDTLQTIVTLGERANEVAMSLLTYSRAQTDTAARPEDLAELISKSVKLVEREIDKSNIEIVTNYEEVPPVSVSSGKIQQLLLNLLINARDAIGSDGVITISLLRLDDSAQIKVSDSGSGISEENKAHIFDPFFSTKGVWGEDDVVGTGIGLSVCRNIAEEHGGRLDVDSVEGKGTTFTLTLPLCSPGQRLAGSLKPGAGFKPMHVLLFSLDRSLDGKYARQAVEVGSELDVWDKVSEDPKVGWSGFDFVICDGRFAAILELLRMTELCDANSVPYVVINSEAVETQIADVVERAAASFGGSPSLVELMESASRGRSPIAT
ncbi:MAG: nitrogen regulation protein NR(II), partial [Candidatus Zixiibacteriota bacterium]